MGSEFPTDWQLEPLEDCMDAIIDYRGKTPRKTSAGIPLITAKVVKGGQIEPPNEFIDPKDYDEWMRRGLPKVGDVLLTTEAPLGEVAQLRESKVALAQRLIALRGQSGMLDNTFLKFLLRSDFVQEQLKARSSGTTVVGIKQSELRRVLLPLPTFSEQQAIACILGALDDKIEVNRRMNGTLEAMARALFQDWFVDFGPVRAKAAGQAPAGLSEAVAALFPDRLVEMDGREVPEGWEIAELGDLANIDKGLSYKGAGLSDDGGMPMVNLGCFSGGGVFNQEKVKRYVGDFRERHVVNSGELVVANTDMTQNRIVLGSPALVPELNGETRFLYTHHVYAVRFNDAYKKWRRFVYFSLLKPEFREIAEGFATGTTVLALPRDGLLRYPLCLPSEVLVFEFDRNVEPMLQKMASNHAETQKLAALRDALLPKLIAGEVRVADAERVVGRCL